MVYSVCLQVIIWSFMRCLDLFYTPLYIARLFKKPQKCSPITEEILLLPAWKLSDKIRKSEISCVDVTKAYISRIQEVNPIINAVIEDRFEKALEEAKRVDELLSITELNESELKEKYPLLGVPITIKGSIAVAGLRHTAGRVDRTIIAEIDGRTVQHAKDAGAIPILTSNVPELCLNWETTNKLIGTTKNPYNSTRTVGGSSGGETSLLGCGASLIGIGSDVAGSLRLPAHYCGVWGHKPSPLAVSCIGHYPDCKNKALWNSVFTLGPLARYSTDLKLLLSVITEPDMKHVLKLNEEVDVKKIKVYYMQDFNSMLTSRVNENVLKAIGKVVDHFDLVCTEKCKKVNIPLMKYCAELSYIRLVLVDEVENLFENDGKGAYTELLKFLANKSKHEFTSIMYGIFRRNVKFIPKRVVGGTTELLERLRNDFIEMLGDDGVFICPVFTSEAYYHGDVLRKLFNFGYLSIFNAFGFPATSCPVGFSKDHLPIGVQVVAAPNLDRLTLRVAEELEKTFGGWKPNDINTY